MEAGQQIGGEVRQQTHGDKFGRADGESAQGEGEQGKTNTGRRQLRRPVKGGGHATSLSLGLLARKIHSESAVSRRSSLPVS